MLFYLFITILLTFLFYMAEKRWGTYSSYFYFLLFIGLASIIEGCRNWDIGADMQGYGIAYWLNAKSYHSIASFLRDLDTKEYGYHLLNYFCSRIGDINVFLFAAGLIKITLVGLTAIHFRKAMAGWLFVFTYLTSYYFGGFSLMRQTLAITFCIYSLTALYDRKYINFFALVLLGYFFHNSAVFMLVMLPLKILVEKNPKHLMLYAYGGLVMVYGFARILFVYIATSGLFAEGKFERYQDSGVTSAKAPILIAVTIFALTYLIPKSKENRKVLTNGIRILATATLCCLLLSSLFEIAFRISYYFAIPMTLCIIMAFWKTKCYKLCVVSFVFLHFLNFYLSCAHGMSGALPYKSSILGL